MTTEDPEFVAIRRPMEVENPLGIEVANLAAGRAVEGLSPDIVDSILENCICQATEFPSAVNCTPFEIRGLGSNMRGE